MLSSFVVGGCRVAGGGEYRPNEGAASPPNDPQDSHRDAQVFSPPYLFRGPRPTITAAPGSVRYGDVFDAATPDAGRIARVTWVRLPSVTHSMDGNQHVRFLASERGDGVLRVTAPATPAQCPPGHYMMFLVDDAGVPSVAKILLVGPPAPAPQAAPGARVRTGALPLAASLPVSAAAAMREEWDRALAESPGAAAVVRVGVRGSCPYGIGACWGGAYAALGRLTDVARVCPIPEAESSTALLLLEDGLMPPTPGPVPDTWESEFRALVNGTYALGAVEVIRAGHDVRKVELPK